MNYGNDVTAITFPQILPTLWSYPSLPQPPAHTRQLPAHTRHTHLESRACGRRQASSDQFLRPGACCGVLQSPARLPDVPDGSQTTNG